MTDNEKRAHELALVLVAEIIKPEYLANEPKSEDGKTVKVDPYQKYKMAYESILASLNSDYPNGR